MSAAIPRLWVGRGGGAAVQGGRDALGYDFVASAVGMNGVDEQRLVDVKGVGKIEGPWQACHFLSNEGIDHLELGLIFDELASLPVYVGREIVDARRREEGNRLEEGEELAAALCNEIVGNLPHLDQSGRDGGGTSGVATTQKRRRMTAGRYHALDAVMDRSNQVIVQLASGVAGE